MTEKLGIWVRVLFLRNNVVLVSV